MKREEEIFYLKNVATRRGTFSGLKLQFVYLLDSGHFADIKLTNGCVYISFLSQTEIVKKLTVFFICLT